MRKEISELLRGAPQDMRLWIEQTSPEKIRLSILTIIVGFGAYGLTAGLWRAPQMGIYVALKMPLLIFITLACNGFLNGMLALLLGTGLGFKQSLLAPPPPQMPKPLTHTSSSPTPSSSPLPESLPIFTSLVSSSPAPPLLVPPRPPLPHG